jgi:D-alanyl-D-alanine carboxypeptidase/D-alanyl-D-alanine-endopeptidase (penicillin-binding protein 4)
VSPTVARLAYLTNKPSDNFLAEILLKNLSAADGTQGTILDGAGKAEAFVRSLPAAGRIEGEFNVADGAGGSANNIASPNAMVFLLDRLRARSHFGAFFDSLPIAGRDGTLANRMKGTTAEGDCRAKTGTHIHPVVSALSGYCQEPGGHLIAFSILMNDVRPDFEGARAAQNRMTVAIATYSAEIAEWERTR